MFRYQRKGITSQKKSLVSKVVDPSKFRIRLNNTEICPHCGKQANKKQGKGFHLIDCKNCDSVTIVDEDKPTEYASKV